MTERNWTAAEDGTTNASAQYLDVVAHVEHLIRGDAHQLLAGRADQTARLIVSNLAHKFGLAPRQYTESPYLHDHDWERWDSMGDDGLQCSICGANRETPESAEEQP